jgi:hypothetical protein
VFPKCCFQLFRRDGDNHLFLLHNFLSRLIVKYLVATKSLCMPTFDFSGGFMKLCNDEKEWCAVVFDQRLIQMYLLADKALV